MSKKIKSMQRIIFWGIGNVGSKIYKFAQKYEISPDFWCDNNSLKWGGEKYNKRIISPREVDYKNDIIFITCAGYGEIEKQILELGGIKRNIVYADRENSISLIAFLSEHIAHYIKSHFLSEIKWKKGILFDLSGGLVLGGVERWCLQSAKMLAENKVQSGYLVPMDGACDIQELPV